MEIKNKILAIIPAYNEAENIGSVIAEIKACQLPLDILVIDDGSVDGTEAAAEAHGARVIRLPFNLGIGGAVQTGFKFARDNGYDIAVQIDGDGQHVASEIPVLLEVVARGEADLCIGSRYLGQNQYRTPAARRLGMLVFTAVNSLLIGQRVTDNTSGFRAYSRRALEFLSRHYPTDYPEPEAVVILGRTGFRIQERAVQMRPRQSGVSSINSLRAIYYMIKVLLAIVVDVFKVYRQVGVQA